MYHLKDIIKEEIVNNKQIEMTNFLNNLEKTPVSTKPFWAKINETRNKKNSNNIPTLIKDGIEYACDESKANLFAEKLKNTFIELTLVLTMNSKLKLMSLLIINHLTTFIQTNKSYHLLFMN